MHIFSESDFPLLNFGHKKRNSRFISVVNNVATHLGSSIPQQNDGWYATKATYSFFSHASVTIESLRTQVLSYGQRKLSGVEKVLFCHDFSELNFNGLTAAGLGYLSDGKSKGVISFNSLSVSTDGVPLALGYQNSFVRPFEGMGKRHRRKTTDYKDRESYEWEKAITQINDLTGDRVHKIHIADREADIFELFYNCCKERSDLLIRSVHNRKLGDGSKLWDRVGEMSEPMETDINIPHKKAEKTETVRVEVRYQKVTIPSPTAKGKSIELTAILLKQVSEKLPFQKELIEWKLLTSIGVTNLEDALQCVQWYCFRWLVERFHYVLKSGTQIEGLQLRKVESLQKAIHIYSLAAVVVMQLVYQSRATPDVSCEQILTKQQWGILYMLTSKCNTVPNKPPTLAQAVKWVAKLGGHLGRKSDGNPGLKTVWIGWKKIMDAEVLYKILKE